MYSRKNEKKDEIDKLLEVDLYGLPYAAPTESAGGNRSSNPVVYFEIGVKLESDINILGRLYVELRKDIVPVAVANFLSLCSGARGVGADGIRYHYKNCRIHRVVKNLFWQCGDLMNTDGECSRSIYDGKLFRDENFILRHTGPGCISYCNRGPDTNGSLFQMCFSHNKDLDNNHVVFGCLADDDSYEVLSLINQYGSDNGKPLKELYISDCGVTFFGE